MLNASFEIFLLRLIVVAIVVGVCHFRSRTSTIFIITLFSWRLYEEATNPFFPFFASPLQDSLLSSHSLLLSRLLVNVISLVKLSFYFFAHFCCHFYFFISILK